MIHVHVYTNQYIIPSFVKDEYLTEEFDLLTMYNDGPREIGKEARFDQKNSQLQAQGQTAYMYLLWVENP